MIQKNNQFFFLISLFTQQCFCFLNNFCSVYRYFFIKFFVLKHIIKLNFDLPDRVPINGKVKKTAFLLKFSTKLLTLVSI